MGKTKPNVPKSIKDVVEDNSKSHINVGQEFISVTSDRLELEARDFKKALKSQNIISKISLTIALGSTVCVANFNNFLNIQSATWKAIYIVGTMISFLYSINSIFSYFKNYKERKVSNFVDTIKASNSNKENPNIEFIEVYNSRSNEK